MLVLNCRIEFKGKRSWSLTQVKNIKIERNTDSLMDWCEIELPSKIKWDEKRECPIKRGDSVKIWLGYNEELELAFRGVVINTYNLETLKIFCGNDMYMLSRKAMERGSHRVQDFIGFIKKITGESNIRIDEKINIGEVYENGASVGAFFDTLYRKYNIRAYYILVEDHSKLCFGRIKNSKIKAVYDVEKHVIKNNLTINRAIEEGIEINLISISNTNEKIVRIDYIGVPPFTKKFYRYRNLTEDELKAESDRIHKEYLIRTYAGSITVFGGRLIEKYDLIGLKENGKRIGIYEVVKNVITFGLKGFRQTITIGNEKKEE